LSRTGKFSHVLVPSVKNLIFDLGGVILDLSVDHTLDSFSQLSKLPRERVQEIYLHTPGFLEYEKGSLDDSGFRNFIRETFSISANDDAIDDCWNAMLRGIPAIKLELLTRLQSEFQVYLLSNTNGIHLEHINDIILPENGNHKTLDSYFHKAYYSHRMGKRKPDAEIFEQVLEENKLVPEQTLFLDDYAVNIEGAKSLGIKTIHVTSPNLILDYFHA
jgi:epoxide hydrolase-like predicted phosphatase